MFDMNGDGYDDLICHRSSGQITISESHIVGNFTMDALEDTEAAENTEVTENTEATEGGHFPVADFERL